VRGVHFQPMSFFGRYQEDLADSGRLTIPALLRALEQQSRGEIKKGDFSPANTEHPLCSFHADYLLEEGRFVLQPSCESACCCSVPSDQARRVVARKWSAPEVYAPTPPEEGSLYRADALDAFLQQRAEVERRQFALSGMAFQDAFNLDLNRLGRCYIAEVSPDGHLVPFCAYNLTGTDHAGFYRGVK